MDVKFYTNIHTVSLSVFKACRGQGPRWYILDRGSKEQWKQLGLQKPLLSTARCTLPIFHGLDLVNLHCIGVMRNCEFFELLNPIEPFCFGLTEEIPIKDELAFLPQGPELGISFYLNQIDNITIRVFWCFLPVMKKTPVGNPFSTGWQRDSCLPWAKTRRAP